jgi:hypothetical protein
MAPRRPSRHSRHLCATLPLTSSRARRITSGSEPGARRPAGTHLGALIRDATDLPAARRRDDLPPAQPILAGGRGGSSGRPRQRLRASQALSPGPADLETAGERRAAKIARAPPADRPVCGAPLFSRGRRAVFPAGAVARSPDARREGARSRRRGASAASGGRRPARLVDGEELLRHVLPGNGGRGAPAPPMVFWRWDR